MNAFISLALAQRPLVSLVQVTNLFGEMLMCWDLAYDFFFILTNLLRSNFFV